MFFLADMLNKKLHLPRSGEALPGRGKPLRTAARHCVSRRLLKGPYPEGAESLVLAMGDFHAAERLFWSLEGVWVTAAGFCGGTTPNPTYQEVGTGLTGHAQAVLVVFDPAIVSLVDLLKLFWETHNPTQGMRQGSDIGTLYRSGIYPRGDGQNRLALASRDAYQVALDGAGFGAVTTSIVPEAPFYFAEAEHQQYLAKNRTGAILLKGTGVAFPDSTQR
jgi:peptide-methionine (S)-S-oxide reductase